MAHRLEKVEDFYISLAFYPYKNVKGCSKKKSIFGDNLQIQKFGTYYNLQI